MVLSMVPGSLQEGEPQPGLRGRFLEEEERAVGKVGEEKDLLT